MNTTQAGTYGIASGVLAGGPLVYSSNKLLLIRGSNNYRYWGTDTGFINDGKWHHLLIYSPGYGQSDINSVRIFIDGIEYTTGNGLTNGAAVYDVDSTIS